MPRERVRYRDRRSSSYSSDSSYDRKKLKSKHKRRSRSKSSSHRRKRSSSRSKVRRRSHSRSASREQHESKHHRSSSKSQSKRSKFSRDRSRSTSRDIKYHKSTKKRSRSNSFDIEPQFKNNLDSTNNKAEKSARAAEAVGLSMTKIPTFNCQDVDEKEDTPTIHDRNILDEINSEKFIPKSFSSSKNKKETQNIVIDLNLETIKVPETEVKLKKDECIINFDMLPSPEELKEMWIKKLYQFRKKMLKGDIS
ncbi:probable ATP-dependent RNA helicase DDX46 [Leptidea sinapis]|uniref:probable ATP-dependent RNA helicase DDX46 n=1 Tax=Leptidea sinapis TaxID=189913 RepID=UPI0021C3A87E|nr:probable ATP-dependent RNA helicase DDX46 [Leptidea sinapis]